MTLGWTLVAATLWSCGPKATLPSLQSPVPSLQPPDTTTLHGKHLVGYQGWFGCPDDGSELGKWTHWSRGVPPTSETATFDLWPDTRELPEEALCDTDFVLPDGSPAPLFSSYHPATTATHFEWMAEASIDGVFLQRFTSKLTVQRHREFRDQVATNVRASAEHQDRIFALMYDLSGHDPATLVEDVRADWAYVVDELQLTQSDAYLSHKGQPVVGVWGLWFTDRPFTPQQAAQLLAIFQDNPEARYQATVVGGVPTHWLSLAGDSQPDSAWADVYLSLDVISPWSVGRYSQMDQADLYAKDHLEPELRLTRQHQIDYLPVVFPGFSWANLKQDPSLANAIPRQGGQFYWHQVTNAVDAGATMLYTAMFDEVDEGTAMFKVASRPEEKPANGTFVSLQSDGQPVPSDWYLVLAGHATRLLRGTLASEK